MTEGQGPLAEATTAYVQADQKLRDAMRRSGITVAEIKPLWEEEQVARRRYAEALTAAGHAVPVGLLDA